MADPMYETGAIFSNTMPAWQRAWYEANLLETLRTKSILLPTAIVKEDFSARQTGQIIYTEVYDTEPNWNSVLETQIWFKGGALDSRSVVITVEPYHYIMKFSDYNKLLYYIDNGRIPELVLEKIRQNLVDTLDILTRNAYLDHPHPFLMGKANRQAIAATDIFDPDLAELARVHLEERDVPGVFAVDDSDVQTILCYTTPRVIHDIRTAAGSNWLDVNQYVGTTRKFTGEVGSWAGVRFIRTNRLRLPNAGEVLAQTTLAADTVPGQGAAATVDSVYQVGQPNSVRYVAVNSVTDFAVGDEITIHKGTAGSSVDEKDGTQETRRIVAIDTTNKRLTFDKPLLKEHSAGDLVTKARTLHASIFVGGPSVVYGVAERPNIIRPPMIDDAMMIHRIGWRGMFKLQLFRPEYFEVVLSAGSED